MTMPIQEYLNNAELIREYTPVVTSNMTISGVTASGQWFVIGQLVIVDWFITFTTSVAADKYVNVSLPVKCFNTASVGKFPLYSGFVDLTGSALGFAAACTVGATGVASTMELHRYDNANWTLGASFIQGTALYRKSKTD